MLLTGDKSLEFGIIKIIRQWSVMIYFMNSYLKTQVKANVIALNSIFTTYSCASGKKHVVGPAAFTETCLDGGR